MSADVDLSTMPAQFTNAMRSAYSTAATRWRAGPARVYRKLAEVMLSHSPVPVSGQCVLDIGTGTGAVSEALIGSGAFPVQVDLADGMLRSNRPIGCPGVAADVTGLPFGCGSVGGAAAGFCLNHLVDPVAGLREMRRVVAPGGSVLSSTFGAQPAHPAKTTVDAVAARYGFQVPRWYEWLKNNIEPRLSTPDAMSAAAQTAGFAIEEFVVHDHFVDAGIDNARAMADYRLGMAHLSEFMQSLDVSTRQRLENDVLAAIEGFPPFRPRVLILAATVLN